MSQQLQVVGLKGKYGEFGAHGVLELQQDASSVYDFMRRIEDQPKWNPGVKLSQIIDRVATNVFHVKQVLHWNFLAVGGDFNMNLAIHEEPDKMQIRTEMLQGSMMRRFSSSVGIQSLGPQSCKLEMSMFMQPSIYVPFGIRHMVGSQVRRQLHTVLLKIKDAVESEPPRRQSLSERCNISGIQKALSLKSHPLDVSVWA